MKTRDITFLAAGIALFVALSMCLRVPVFENYYLCLGYVVMTVYMWCFAWYEGALIGFFGVILYCMIGGLGVNGMPGWALGNIIIGVLVGRSMPYVKKIDSLTGQVVITAIITTAAAALGILGVKSIVDSFVVGQPFLVRAAKNTTSFIADAFVIAASLPVCIVVEGPAKQLRYH